MILTIAVAQIPQNDNPEENLEKILAVMDQIDADIICFPETALSGNYKGGVEPQRRAIAKKAKQKKIWCIYGSYAMRNGSIYNEAYVVNRRGAVEYTYQKEHLWSVEAEVIPGRRANKIVNTEFGAIGLIICWDIAFPGATRWLMEQGALIVFCPTYWYGRQYRTTKIIEMLPQARAFENQIYFVLCDAFTPETAARSRICSPLKVLAQADILEEIITATINTDELEELRNTFNCWI